MSIKSNAHSGSLNPHAPPSPSTHSTSSRAPPTTRAKPCEAQKPLGMTHRHSARVRIQQAGVRWRPVDAGRGCCAAWQSASSQARAPLWAARGEGRGGSWGVRLRVHMCCWDGPGASHMCCWDGAARGRCAWLVPGCCTAGQCARRACTRP